MAMLRSLINLNLKCPDWWETNLLFKLNYPFFLACVASVSVRFRSKERGKRVKDRAKNGPYLHFLALVSFLARPKPKIPFLGLSLLPNQTETLATQAIFFLINILGSDFNQYQMYCHYRISSNNSRGRLFLFSQQERAIIRTSKAIIWNIAHWKSCPKYFVLLSH